jgi:hypothetical protein
MLFIENPGSAPARLAGEAVRMPQPGAPGAPNSPAWPQRTTKTTAVRAGIVNEPVPAA